VKLRQDEAMIAAQNARIAGLERETGQVAALQKQIAAQNDAIARLAAALAHLSRSGGRLADAGSPR
jgi:hypothetical protein